MAGVAASMGGSRVSVSRILSYVFDWIIILLFVIAGGLFSKAKPFHRVFSLADTTISYPLRPDTVSVGLMVVLGLVVPGVFIALICLLFVPGPTAKNVPKRLIWKRKFWELNTGWMGLGMSLSVTFFVTQGSKLLFGRPRPDLLARCDPDLSAINQHIAGGFGDRVLQGQYLVDYTICRQTDRDILSNGFMSFPSGHASFTWAGLLYLTFFVCSKFAIAIPWALPSSNAATNAFPAAGSKSTLACGNSRESGIKALHETGSSHTYSIRTSAAAPPLYLLILAIIPVGIAIYVTSSRYTDYRHHPFDLLVGTLLGSIMAWVSFRWYHAPIRRGAGWSWGPRSVGRSWAIGVGVQGYRSEREDKWMRDEPDAIERGETNGDGSDHEHGNDDGLGILPGAATAV